MSGTVNFSDAGTRMLIGPPRLRLSPLRYALGPLRGSNSHLGTALRRSSLQVNERSGCKHALDVESSPQQLRVHHQSHQPASGYRQFRCGSAEHSEIFVARRYMEALQCLEELLSGGLLANAHAMRCILGLARHVIDRIEPAGKQRLY